MFRVFSDSCLSLEDMDTVFCPNLQERPHVLGPGADFFTEDGEPVRPQPAMETLQKVFSGSALDLNAMNSGDEEPTSPLGQAPNTTTSTGRNIPVSTILNQLTSETEKERARAVKSKIIVLVIGDFTYISSHMVAKLLDIGYTVRLTLSDTSKPQILEMFYNRETANRLSIIQVEMTNSAALRDAIRGCRYIVHCGCPSSAFSTKDRNASTKVTNGKTALSYHTEAVQALFDGVQLSGKSTVKRVILTGAATSVISEAIPGSGLFDESCWSTTPADKDSVPYAKLIFEKEARRISQMLGVELLVLLPSIMLGPSRTEEMGEANNLLQTLARGSPYFPFCPDLYWNFVDVNDVAEALVRSLEAPAAEAKDKRIIISGECLGLPELGSIIKKRFPHLNPPTRKVSNRLFTLMLSGARSSASAKFIWKNLGVKKALDNRCAKQCLQLQFTPIEETVVACIDRMIRAEVLPGPNQAPPQGLSTKVIVAVSLVVGAAAVLAVVARKKS